MRLTLSVLGLGITIGLALHSQPRRIVLFVDPCNEDARVEVSAFHAAAERCSAEVFAVTSDAMADALKEGGRDNGGILRAPAAGDEIDWAAHILGDGAKIEAVLCGSDGGLACAERLQHTLLPQCSNGIDPARRDKYLANERLRRARMAVAAQAVPKDWQSAEDFLTKLVSDDGLLAVLKPRRGTASVGVFVARSMEQAREIYTVLSNSLVSIDTSELQASNQVVVQELLDGDEWIVDTVSRGGEHKVVALWRYDKGAANNAPFVYFGAQLMPATAAEADLIEYACSTLDALSWKWGPAHIEIRRTRDGPRLIEVNAGRCNGLDFKLLADLCYGYNQFDATVDAFLCAERWEALPSEPPLCLECRAWLVTLVSHVGGNLVRVRHVDKIKAMRSLLAFEPCAMQPGESIRHTTDLDTCAGVALLAHRDGEVLAEDYEKLRALQSSMFEVV